MHDHTLSRRKYLSSGSIVAATALAGCLGGMASNEGTGTNDISYEDKTSWRETVSENAATELEDESLTFWARNPSAKKVLSSVLNGEPPEGSDRFPDDEPIIADDSPWAPLKGNVTVNEMTPSKQATKYRRQAETNSVKVDVLTGDVGEQIKDGTTFMDFSKMPSWQEFTPERLKKATSKQIFYKLSTMGIVYNTETVDETPMSPLDLLDDQFSGRIIVDESPSMVVPSLFLDEYADTVPPRFEAMGSDTTGSEFIDGIANQDPTFTQSAYKASLEVGKGAVDASLFTPLPIMYSLQEDDLPVKAIDHPAAFVTSPNGLGVPEEPPHPNAAKLLVDFVLSNPNVKTCRSGWATPDLESSNPDGLKEQLKADWRTPKPAVEIENISELKDMWHSRFDIPSA